MVFQYLIGGLYGNDPAGVNQAVDELRGIFHGQTIAVALSGCKFGHAGSALSWPGSPDQYSDKQLLVVMPHFDFHLAEKNMMKNDNDGGVLVVMVHRRIMSQWLKPGQCQKFSGNYSSVLGSYIVVLLTSGE